MRFVRALFFVLIPVALGFALALLMFGCSYEAGVTHGRYLAEKELNEDVRECSDALTVKSEMEAACDDQLFECLDGAQYTDFLQNPPRPEMRGNRNELKANSISHGPDSPNHPLSTKS